MIRRLRNWVHVEDETGQNHIFGPDDVVPDWAAAKITNPKAWAQPAEGQAEPVKLAPMISTSGANPGAALDISVITKSVPTDPASGGAGGEVERPPMSGSGSGGAEWIAYARSLGIEVADGTARGDVLELIDAHESAAATANEQ